MKRHSQRVLLLFVLSFTVFMSCKKTNPLSPTPSNVRLTSFSIINNYLNPGATVIKDNYRFYYNNLNQVSSIAYTTNNPLKSNTISILNYVGNKIYDTITDFSHSTIFEVDTFVTDYNNNIDTTYIRGVRTVYGYSNNLLSSIDSNDNVTSIFTSYNGYFIKNVSPYGAIWDVNYQFYTDQANRIGDFLQLNSIARYGFNMYRYSALVRSITTPTDTTRLTYSIDADSKVTQVTAVFADTFSHFPAGSAFFHPFSDSMIYNLQYETYQ